MLPKSLSSRLLLAFTFIVVLTLAISAVGTLFLLREQQEEAAEERVGRLAEPIAVMLALLERSEVPPDQIQNTVEGFAESFDVRVLLVDDEGNVTYDTEGGLRGGVVDPAIDTRQVERRGSAEFRMAPYDEGGEDLVLFAAASDSIELTSAQLGQIQAFISDYAATGDSDPAVLQSLVSEFAANIGAGLSIPLPSSRPLVAVDSAEITAAWRDVLPQITIAGGIALVAAFAVAALFSRSITGRLARVTRAAQAMATGNYDQRVEAGGEDEIGRLANAFNDMATQVSRSDQMMRDLLGNVSHELKTPLTSIQGFSHAMEDGAISSDEEYKEAGRIISVEAERMNRLIEDLLELSRLESGQAMVRREPVDLEDVLHTCAERVERATDGDGTKIDLDVHDLPRIQGDGRRLEQVFTNLMENAVRHSDDGREITVRAEAENGHVKVAVHNTGSYIPEEELPRVFERFFQLDRNRAVTGSGLGLAIVSEVVHAHGGTVRAESARDRGTQFVVDLPVKPPTNGR